MGFRESAGCNQEVGQAAFEKLIPETEKGKKAFEKRIDALRELSDKFVELLEKPSVSNLSTIVFAKMVKDSSITRKILDVIHKIFSQTIKKFFDPGRNWEK